MAINHQQITTDITLELDEAEIPLADFTAACEAFSGLVKELARHVEPKVPANSWNIRVYDGSAGLGFAAMPGTFSADTLDRLRREISEGLQTLADGFRPAAFTDRAIEHARNLGSLFKRKVGEPGVRLWYGRDASQHVGRVIAQNAKAMLEAAYEEEGSIEGRLERLDAHNHLQLVVYDVLDDRAIKCEVDDELLKQAQTHWRKRVEVTGRVRYRKDGQAVSIRAKEIIGFPSPEDIPSLDEVRRLLSTK